MNSQLSTNQIRANIRKARQSLLTDERHIAEQKIYKKIAQHDKIALAKHIAIFLSFDGELNTQPIIEYLWSKQKSVYLPIVSLANNLIFLPYKPSTVLKKNKFGIFEPEFNSDKIFPLQNLDIIFTPLVAFDSRKYRIGMGGGYYDRLLENYQQINVYPIGLAFSCQYIDVIPNQPWDIKLPEIITD